MASPRACSGAMKCGVPMICPRSVGKSSATAGLTTPKSISLMAVPRPWMRKMLESLRSRWITPRAWTAAIAAAERRTTSTASRIPSGARRWRWPRSSPSSHSIARNRRPSCQVPCPMYWTMLGCRRSARMAISRANLVRSCADAVARSSLTAICCPVSRSTPRKTSPMPPLPTRASIVKRSLGGLNSGSTASEATRDPEAAERENRATGVEGSEEVAGEVSGSFRPCFGAGAGPGRPGDQGCLPRRGGRMG